MKRLIAFPLQDDGTIMVEMDEEARGGVTRGGRPSEVTERAQQTFEAALAKIKPVATSLIAQLRDLSQPPQEVEVEFGLKLSAEAGAFIASASTEAHFLVKLTWQQEK